VKEHKKLLYVSIFLIAFFLIMSSVNAITVDATEDFESVTLSASDIHDQYFGDVRGTSSNALFNKFLDSTAKAMSSQSLQVGNTTNTSVSRFEFSEAFDGRYSGATPFLNTTDLVFGMWIRPNTQAGSGLGRSLNYVYDYITGYSWGFVLTETGVSTVTITTYEDGASVGSSLLTLNTGSWYWIENLLNRTNDHHYIYINGTMYGNSAYHAGLSTNCTIKFMWTSASTLFANYDFIRLTREVQFPPLLAQPPVSPPAQGISLFDIPARIALALGVTAFIGGIIASIAVFMFVVLPFVIFTTNIYAILASIVLSLGLCVALGWLPAFMWITVIVFIGLLFAMSVRNLFTRGGGE
jgi:hypothetical protein